MPSSALDELRWQREAAFFDHQWYPFDGLPPATIRRYRELRKPWLPAERPFHLLGNVEGKRILEIGCSDGTNAILLSVRGAEVVGVDVSPRALEAATRRVQLHGLEDRVHFVCDAVERYIESSQKSFDAILGIAILHHLLPVLDLCLAGLKRILNAGGAVVFLEPVSMTPWLRKLRLALPLGLDGTPDERPLEARDLAIIRTHFPDLQIQYFGVGLRILHRFFLRNYELSTPIYRSIYDLTARLDHLLVHRLDIDALRCVACLHATSQGGAR